MSDSPTIYPSPMAANQTGVDNHKKFESHHILEALRDPKCWCVWACGIGYAVANAGITNFNPLIIEGYGFSQTKTVLMATPQAAVAMVAGATLTAISHFVQNLRCLFWIVSALIGLAGAVMVHTLDIDERRDASLAGVYIMGFYNVPWVFMLSLNSSNTAGTTKKSFTGITVAVCYAVGNIIGPLFFLTSQAPRYSLGIGSMMFAFALMASSGVAYYLIRQRKVTPKASPRASSTPASRRRGHRDMYGAILRPEAELVRSGEAHAGVLFCHNNGYSSMCGHATIALGRFLVDTHDDAVFPARAMLGFDASK
ncbi:hypothetical protein INS49_009502 [Diaporthe citri]|uniref:uncharacterized protein n=1 Tax=Diaporthe citri TaxID=83186 RepID=UPI001C7F3EF5|nr:uncharacterized protein INS49_009502 [Diaporthe citri]KAG6361277.1 hypothetical protein INS49_009502 [Diaporthe citri]